MGRISPLALYVRYSRFLSSSGRRLVAYVNSLVFRPLHRRERDSGMLLDLSRQVSYWLAPVLAVVVISSTALGQSTTISFDPVPFPEGNVTFTVTARLDAVTPPNPKDLQDYYSGVAGGDVPFSLFVDPASIQARAKYKRYVTFDALLRRDQGTPVWYAFSVQAETLASFADSLQNVRFTVKDGKNTSRGTIQLPVHSPAYKAALEWIGTDTPSAWKVKLSSSGDVTILFRNTLPGVSVKVLSADVHTTKSGCWNLIGNGHKDTSNLAPIESGSQLEVPLPIVPRSTAALGRTLTAFSNADIQDTLSVTLTYQAAQGGFIVPQDFAVPVRFDPTFWSFVLFIGLGAVIGMLLFLVRLNWKVEWPEVLAKLAYVLGAEVVAWILVVAAKTKFQLFGLDLDPRQLLPAAIIAFGAAGGSAAVSFVKKIIDMFKNS